ncbi:MAG: hypothetical protein M1338_05180, partial [Patescibacteria group bacterium]|nr:hypothetical protein [Patescibacteria group bacterium]
ILEEARQTNNQDERNNKYQAFQKILDDQKPAIVLEQTNWQFAATDKIKGIVPTHWGASPADRFFEIWKWYLNEKRVKK